MSPFRSDMMLSAGSSPCDAKPDSTAAEICLQRQMSVARQAKGNGSLTKLFRRSGTQQKIPNLETEPNLKI